MINRSIAPATRLPETLPPFSFDNITLKNGVHVFFSKEHEELVRVSFFFRCGSLYSTEKGLVSALSKLLLSGTDLFSAYEIQEKLDFYGAYVDIESGFLFVSLHVFCIQNNVDPILSFLHEVLENVRIPNDEFELYRRKSIETLKVNEQKTAFLSKRIFNSTYFGLEHPYGRYMTQEDYLKLSVDQVQGYYENRLLPSLDFILVNSPINTESINLFGNNTRETTNLPETLSLLKKEVFSIHHQHNDAVQASIYAGMPAPTRKHPDYPAWSVLITLFGGYFGSRLMKNIREDKGYTYGIGSNTLHLHDSSLLIIRSDVKNEAKLDCMHEIMHEMTRLFTETIREEELTTVKNYMLGNIQRSFDGSLARVDRYKTIMEYELKESYFHNYVRQVKNITKEELYSIASIYLNTNNLNVVIVGDFGKN
ncbi:MAG: hypothetical protein GC180_10890 [Bacteroidetes bacterium]|nr:hypothetical protein [Bacteroidota bacterium]